MAAFRNYFKQPNQTVTRSNLRKARMVRAALAQRFEHFQHPFLPSTQSSHLMDVV